jgi:succinate dehydrogenase / fumarate reductase iron-sulfur subunit
MGYDLKMAVWRGDENGGELVDYTVAVEEGEVVLDAIHRLQATQAGDLAVRWNCKAGKCGSCSAEINGRPRLLCMTRLSIFEPAETITVTPMRTFPVLRDLVTDVSFNYEKAKQVTAFTPPADLKPGDYRMQQMDVERSQEFRKCIECFLCQNTCHVVRDHEENKPAFAGPRFFIRYAELDMHPLDTVNRKAMLQEEQGLGLCNITKCCTEVCPEHIKITDNAIIPMKERVVDLKFDPLMRARRPREVVRAEPLRTGATQPPSHTAAPPRTSDMVDADRAVVARGAYTQTRTSLHGVAELLLAGPQRRANRSIKLVVTDHGFATGPLPRPPWLIAVRGHELVLGDGDVVLPLRGTFADLAAAAGLACTPPADAYPPASGCKAGDAIHIDPHAAEYLLRALRLGRDVCQELAAAHAATDPPSPVLWPEHFDVGITLDSVTYGVSPGDDLITEPYAYVGPHELRQGEFWNQSFGAARTMTDFDGAQAVRAFFEEGRTRAAADPPAAR